MTSHWQTIDRFSIAGAIDDPVNGQPMMRIENRLILVAELLFCGMSSLRYMASDHMKWDVQYKDRSRPSRKI